MPTQDLKVAVKFDGEKEYKQELKEIKKGMEVLNSEMRLSTERFRENADSVDALKERSGVLDKQLHAHQEKVAFLRKVYADAAEQLTENNTKTQEYLIQLNNAETALLRHEKAVKENDEALEKATKSTEEFGEAEGETQQKTSGLGDMLGDLAGKLGINLPEGATQGLEALNGIDGAALGAAGAVAGVAAAVVEVIKQLGELSIAQAAAADDIMTTALVTGMSTDTVQELRYAAELLDVSVDTISSTMAKNIRSMSAARDGNEAAAEAYKTLSIRVADSRGQLRDSEDVYWETIDALGRMRNETERDALAMELFGRSARELNPLLEAGSEGARAFAEEAHQIGYVLSPEELAVLGDLDDQVQRFTGSMETAKNMLALEFAPAMTELVRVATEELPGLAEALINSGFLDSLITIASVSVDVASALGGIAEILEPISELQFIPLTVALAGVADVLTVIVNLIGAAIEGIKSLFGHGDKNKLDSYLSAAAGVFTGDSSLVSAFSKIGENFGYNADGTDNWRGGWTWVGERGPELVNLPSSSRILSNENSMAAIGGTIVNVTVDARNIQQFSDIIRMAETARQTQRRR